jgi:hypothetical protein
MVLRFDRLKPSKMLNEKRLADLSHGMAGFATGLLHYFVYFHIIRVQPFTRDSEGWSLVWGYRLRDLLNWGGVFPIAFFILGLIFAIYRPNGKIGSPSFLKILTVFILFMLTLLYFQVGNTIIRTFTSASSEITTGAD